jgi:hypothetical protein
MICGMDVKTRPREAGTRLMRADELAGLTNEDIRATLRPAVAAITALADEPDLTTHPLFLVEFVKVLSRLRKATSPKPF